MKFIISFALLVICVAVVQSQTVCRGRPVFQVCTGGRDEGNNNLVTCRITAQQMWYYDSGRRACVSLNYRGCGGNNNRYCSVAHCQQMCRR